MMLTPEQGREIKTMPTNRAQIDAYNFLRACAYDLKEAQEPMKKRLKLLPHGWRDLRMLTTVLEHLCEDLKWTFEPEKREHIIRNGDRIQHKLVFGPSATPENDDYLMSKQDMGVLIYAASKQCELCLGSPQDCRQCTLGRTMDRTSFVSRQDRAWWEVFERSKRTDIARDPGYKEETA